MRNELIQGPSKIGVLMVVISTGSAIHSLNRIVYIDIMDTTWGGICTGARVHVMDHGWFLYTFCGQKYWIHYEGYYIIFWGRHHRKEASQYNRKWIATSASKIAEIVVGVATFQSWELGSRLLSTDISRTDAATRRRFWSRLKAAARETESWDIHTSIGKCNA